MRYAGTSNRINDDDFFSGGPCPSCRLAINKETGRLKWCMGGNDSWRLRVKLMLLIPAILLPITIVFIALSRLQASHKLPIYRTPVFNTSNKQDKQIINKESVLCQNSCADVEHTTEEVDERVAIPGLKTSYVPTDTPHRSQSLQRRKRGANEKDLEITTSINARDSVRKDILLKMVDDTFYAPHRKNKPMNSPLSNNLKQGSKIPMDDTSNTVIDCNSEAETGEAYNNGKMEIGGYSQEEKRSEYGYDDKEAYADIDIDDNDENDDDIDGTQNESNNRYSTFVNDAVVQLTTPSDIHAFWKGEDDFKSIREAQAKIMLKYMDRSVDPCQDFYQFACGNWAHQNPIPKDKAGYDTFEMLRESLDSVLKELLEDPINVQNLENTNDATVKAKQLFQSCMNYEILERRMEQPLIKLLDELGGWPILKPDWEPEKFDWLLLVAQLRLYNNDILISEWVGPDIKNSDQYIIQFDQTSLGLPTRDYFLQPSNTVYLEAYKNYLIKVATLLGASPKSVAIQADELIQFETNLAKITSSPDERRNVSELYQRMTIGELEVLVPQIDWHRYLSIVLARPANVSEPVVVFALQYIKDLVNLLSDTNSRTVANYLLWRFVRHRVNTLDDRFQEAKQKFYFILFGREQAPLRWKNCVAQVNSNMGMAVGSMFVRRYFDENSKNDTLSMTREIQRSFRESLNNTCWIDENTKRLASEKVDAMLLRIGYPDFILQSDLLNERYKDVTIYPDKYFENTLNILQHLTRVEQDRLGSPVNKTLWNTAPAVVNAYYSRNKNQIMFPAGILQPPFYHRYFPRSLNYGGIGVVIGHEITHGFDDKGRLFDKDGNLHRWWKDGAIDGFHQRAQCLIDQYSQYIVTEVGLQIDGMNTQGENIADNGGIKQAFRAYENWLKINKDADETLPGINATGKQLFFLNFAQVWCGSMRPEATKNKLKTAVHSPGKFRVIGTLSNSKEFSQVFECPIGTRMNPIDKCSVW